MKYQFQELLMHCHCWGHHILCPQQVTLNFNTTNKHWFLCKKLHRIKSFDKIFNWSNSAHTVAVMPVRGNIDTTGGIYQAKHVKFPSKSILWSYYTSSCVKWAHFSYVSWPNNDVRVCVVTTLCTLGGHHATRADGYSDKSETRNMGMYKSLIQVNYSFSRTY